MFGYYKLRRKIKEYFIHRKVPEQINFSFKKSNEKLFLFGNGYTLNQNLDFNDLKGNDIFVCNLIWKHQSFEKLRKNNNLIWFGMDSIQSFKTTVPSIFSHVEEAIDAYYGPIINSDVCMCVKDCLLDYLNVNYNKSNIYSSTIWLNKLFVSSGISKNRIKNWGFGHTPQLMILFGILMGYKEIHLHGLEHNYARDILTKNPKCGTHFYNEPFKDVLELNMGKGLPRTAYKQSLSSLFEGSANTFKVYENLDELAREQSIEILDHSDGSLFMFQDYSLWDLVEPKDKKNEEG